MIICPQDYTKPTAVELSTMGTPGRYYRRSHKGIPLKFIPIVFTPLCFKGISTSRSKSASSSGSAQYSESKEAIAFGSTSQGDNRSEIQDHQALSDEATTLESTPSPELMTPRLLLINQIGGAYRSTPGV